jgi:glutamate-1-semialdehyde 2,1-aminomutase
MEKSHRLFLEAQRLIPGGVNSPVRACKAVGTEPLFLESAKGAYVWDVDGNRYIDYVCSWGPLILGHSHPKVVEAIREQVEKATTFGAPTELEVEMARLITTVVPSMEKVRLVNSGTEATMSALRLARAYTGRDHILKFNGCYHGHVDSLLVQAGSGLATLGIPDSLGVPQSFAQTTISLPYNNLNELDKTLEHLGREIAAIIVEPVAGNMGVVLPEPGFLEGLRDRCNHYGILLIFDEVITGFRLGLGGAQGLFNVRPDITCLGKIIGGGLPVGAYGGRGEIMELVAPQGRMYQAGTLSGNPIAMAAGVQTLKVLMEEDPYQGLSAKAQILFGGIMEIATSLDFEITVNYIGSLGTLFFAPPPIRCYEDAKKSNLQLFRRFYQQMLKQGIYLPPSQFEAWFISIAHGDDEINKTLEAVHRALNTIKDE